MLEKLKETIGDALTDNEIKSIINEEISLKADEKANGLVSELLESKTKELEEQCKEFKKSIEENNEEEIENRVQEKVQELEQQCEEFKKKLEKRSKILLQEEIEKLHNTLTKYTDRVVNDFLHEHEETFTVNENQMKTESVLQMLSAVCAVAGVRAQEITEGIYSRKNRINRFNEKRITQLEEQLSKSEDKVVRLQDELETESNKSNELEESFRDYLKQNKELMNEKEQSKNEFLNQINELKNELDRVQNTNEQLSKKNLELVNENQKIVKMGVITEMQKGMSLTESKKFEKIAENIPFEVSKDYFDKLKTLKDEILKTTLNEVTDNVEVKEEQSYSSRWDNLI